jgi:signal transduction histidine kinase
MSVGSIRRIQLRLTAWYIGVSATVLLLFGVAVFAVVNRQMGRAIDHDLDRLSGEAAQRLSRAGGHVPVQSEIGPGIGQVRSPRRSLYVFDSVHRSWLAEPPVWLDSAAKEALARGTPQMTLETAGEHNWRLNVRRVSTGGGEFVLVAVADGIEIEEQYPALLAGFTLATLLSLAFLGVGGWVLARKSLTPMQRNLEMMRRFVADASHELRTPAAVLQTRAEVALQRPRAPGEYIEAIVAMKTEAQRLGRIVDALLLLAAADEHRLAVRRERVYLDDLVVEASTTVSALASQKQIRLKLAKLNEAPVAVDPVLVRQLVTILLDNAVKYTPPGGDVEVSVGIDDGQCQVRVADTGPGIPVDMMSRVFERFVRADAARSRNGGAGLGLAIARAIADAHGAHVDMRSTPGSGTTITVGFQRADVSS